MMTPAKIPAASFTSSLIKSTALNEKITEIMVSKPSDPAFSWQAGQYVKIRNPHTEDDRPYTIATYHTEQLIFYLQHETAYNHALIHAMVEQGSITFTGPYGQCVYQPKPEMPLLLIAGGTGFAQLRAIAEAAFEDHYPSPIYAFWGVRKENDFHSLALCKQWQAQYPDFHLTLAVSEPTQAWQGPMGFIHDRVLATHCNLSNYRCYAAGSPEMMIAVKKAFTAAGLNIDRFHTD